MEPQISTKDHVLAVIGANEDRIKAFGVRRLGLFGSFARQEQDPGSDIDFLVEFDKDRKTFDNFINLSFLLEDTLARRVELVTPESLSPYLSRYILDEVEYVSFSS
jgi:predicted nucleotidyltransferase